MIHIALLLHIYQPPCQSYTILKKIAQESYIPFLNVIKKLSNAKITLNINGSLTELLKTYEFEEVISLINELVLAEKIRFTGSGMYHPILPLLPPEEVERQIQLNEEYNSSVLENFAGIKGFFPPEMCISQNTLNVVKKLGFKWIIADGVACPAEWPTNKYYKYDDLAVLFRDSIISNEIAFKDISAMDLIRKLEVLFEQDYYLIIALDGETFGHHIKDYETLFLEKFINLINENEDIELVFVDDILNLYPSASVIRPIDSSWSTTHENIINEVPYPLWANPVNRLHIIQNKLQEKVYEFIELIKDESIKDKTDTKFQDCYQTVRRLLDKGEFSCKLWWACPEHFDFNIIIEGNQYLIKSAINALKCIMNMSNSKEIKFKARNLYENILLEYQLLLREIGTHFEYKYKFGHF
ncbi:MAG: hypothetical protein ACTSQO_10060 [Candidatus Helarchaeota archaeon]